MWLPFLIKWSRRESNPCPKAHSLSFYYHSSFLGAALPALFPTTAENEQSAVYGSFILRPRAQSLARVVSHIVDARIPKCECPGADERQ